MTFPEPYHYNIWADLLDEETGDIMVEEILIGIREALDESLMDPANVSESMEFLKKHTPDPESAVGDMYDLSHDILARAFGYMMVFLTPDHIQDNMSQIMRRIKRQEEK